MRRTCFYFNAALILLIIISGSCTKKEVKEGIQTSSELISLFTDPPSEYRSAPLWDWNEDISEEGIDFQMKEFKNAGIGGVFVHPRPGLITEYLSEEWFYLFDYTVQKGKELGMKVWIYDENSYPSGFAGGHVPAEMPDSYRHGTGLKLDIQNKLDIIPSDTIEVILQKTESGFKDITGTLDENLQKEGTFYIFRKTYPGKSPWYGGFTYVDLLYPEVTQKFLEFTMTKGYERNKADFGTTILGSFTDEPNLEAAMQGGTLLRWTPALWESFQNRWGYDLRINLPSLIEETGNWKKVRHDYYELILELFIDNWAKPYSEYCDSVGLKFTGHYWEHGWPEPTHGFDESAFYLYHQMPGIDMLGNRLDTTGLGGQFGNDRAVRELRSVANQAGWTRTMSETYGGGGWEMSFETQKRLVDWETVLGVNFVNQHLSYYSLNGVRKFDYPPSFTYHEPWWEDYRLMGDYIGRISMAMTAGEQVNKTLVLQPNTTAWMYFSRKVKNPSINTIRDGFKNFVYKLEQLQLEYDLGSEYVIRAVGNVEGKTLKVGKRNYDLLVIPAEMENLDNSTFVLLKNYLKNGGKVLSFNKNIGFLDGEASKEINELAAANPYNWINSSDLNDPQTLDLLVSDDFKMSDMTRTGMLYHQRRVLKDGQLIFLVNSHKTKNVKTEITVSGHYVLEMDLVSGKTSAYPAEFDNGNVSFQVELPPVGSALFCITHKNPETEKRQMVSGEEKVIQSIGPTEVKRESDNILMINYLDLKTSKSEKKDIYFMNALIDLFKENGVEMGNPWQHKIQYKQNYIALDTLFGADSGFEASYHFDIGHEMDSESLKSVRAVVERPELWKVSINGYGVEKLSGSWWIEKGFPQYEIGKFLKIGTNTITLKAPRMNVFAEVMPIYILGDFNVIPAKKGFEITNKQAPGLGSWLDYGLPFYSQKVAYSQSFQLNKKEGSTFKVRLNNWKGSVAEVWVNGQKAGLVAWKPYELNITSLLNEGDNEITVKIVGSLKNTFGFFYEDNKNWIFGPYSWNNAPEHSPAPSAYYLIDCGLFVPFELIKSE